MGLQQTDNSTKLESGQNLEFENKGIIDDPDIPDDTQTKSMMTPETILGLIIFVLIFGLGIWYLVMGSNQKTAIDKDKSEKCNRVDSPIGLYPGLFTWVGVCLLISGLIGTWLSFSGDFMALALVLFILSIFLAVFYIPTAADSNHFSEKVCQETADKYGTTFHKMSFYSPIALTSMSIVALIGFVVVSKTIE